MPAPGGDRYSVSTCLLGAAAATRRWPGWKYSVARVLAKESGIEAESRHGNIVPG